MKLQRYRPTPSAQMLADEAGLWVKIDDIGGLVDKADAMLVDPVFREYSEALELAKRLRASADRLDVTGRQILAAVASGSDYGCGEAASACREAAAFLEHPVNTTDETGWLIELKGQTPQWATVNPNDYDEHWTGDASKALRFARKEDAQAYIDHIGWTEAFPSEHMWCAPHKEASND